MTRKAFMELPGVLVTAREVRAVLGIRDARTWAKVVESNPQIAHTVPGMKQPRYVKERVLALIPE
jgi:hypothetical protein